MKSSLKSAISKGLPVYAECGGFVYLKENLTDLHGTTYKMLGVLPGNIIMTERLQNFGYYEIEAKDDNMLCTAGERINTHFFHRSKSDHEGDGFIAKKQSGKTFPCIVTEGSIFAGYQHLHFWGNTNFAQNFIKTCVNYREGYN